MAPYDVKEQRNGTPSTLNISIAELIKNVNPSDGDFLKYIPDEMLDETQIESKREALEKDRQKIESLRKSVTGTRLAKYEPSINDIRELCLFFGVSADYLLDLPPYDRK